MAVGGTAVLGALSGGVGLAAVGAATALEVGVGCVLTAAGGGAAAGAATGSVGAAIAGLVSYFKKDVSEKEKDKSCEKKSE